METIATSTGNNKAAGIGGFVFLAAVLAENVMRGQPVPNDAPIADILAYYQKAPTMLEISHSLYLFTIPALLLYASGIFRRVRSNDSEIWARAGFASASIMLISFAAVIISDMVLTSLAQTLPSASEAIVSMFKVHAAAFVLNEAVLGTTMIGFGMAAKKTRAFAGWLATLAIVGGIILIVAAIPADAVVGGSMFGMIGLAGFLCWLVWVGVTSAKMLKEN